MRKRSTALLTLCLFVLGFTATFASERPERQLDGRHGVAKLARKLAGPIVRTPVPPKDQNPMDTLGASAARSDRSTPGGGSLAGLRGGAGFASSSAHEITERQIRAAIKKLG